MTIYVAGAVKADPDYRAKFKTACALVEAQYPNASIVNPVAIADAYLPIVKKESLLMLMLLREIASCTHIYRIADNLPSAGADIELAWAQYIGIERLPDLEAV